MNFDVRAGEVHAVVGENGAGKSTLGRLLTGALLGDEGELVVGGRVVRFGSPREALAEGIAIIPQELQLVTSLSVAENISLGRELRSPSGLVDRGALHSAAREQLDAVGATHISTNRMVADQSPGDRQLVAIARALACHARCLIMDEPIASLEAAERVQLERVIRALVAGGVGIVYVSHKLDEVLRLADRVTVLRDGRCVITRAVPGLTAGELVRLMLGRDVSPSELPPTPSEAREVLRTEKLSVAGHVGGTTGTRLQDVTLRVRAGEVVGLAGLVGAGRTDLPLALVGAQGDTVHVRIWLDGREYAPTTPAHGILVFRQGRIVAEFDRTEATEEKVLAAAAGGATPQDEGVSALQAPESASDALPGGGGSRDARALFTGHLSRNRGAFGILAVLALAIVFSPTHGGRPVFLDIGNLTDILRQVAEKGILAVGMTAVVIAGGIDLSVGSLLAFAATLAAWLLMKGGAGLGTTAAIVLVVSGARGWLNGIVVARWKLPAFVATLATMSAARGAARYPSGGTAIPLCHRRQ